MSGRLSPQSGREPSNTRTALVAPIIAGTATWVVGAWSGNEAPVDLADFFVGVNTLDAVVAVLTPEGRVLAVPKNPPKSWEAILDAVGPAPTAVPFVRLACTDPAGARQWLFTHRWAEALLMDLRRIPRTPSAPTSRESVSSPMPIDRGVVGQTWETFTVDADPTLDAAVRHGRATAVAALKEWERHPAPPVVWPLTEGSPAEHATTRLVWSMIAGQTPGGPQMRLGRALLYTAAGVGALEARQIEFGDGHAPSDAVLQALAALHTTP